MYTVPPPSPEERCAAVLRMAGELAKLPDILPKIEWLVQALHRQTFGNQRPPASDKR